MLRQSLGFAELKGAQAKDLAAMRDFEEAKRSKLFTSILVDRESKLMKISREVGNIESEIKGLERELMGDWTPKSWG